MPLPLFTPGKDPVPIVQEAGWAPGPVWTGAENLTPHRDSIPGLFSLQPVAITTTLPNIFQFSEILLGDSNTKYEVDNMHYLWMNYNTAWLCVISGFRFEVAENCALLGCYAEISGKFLQTFWDNLSVPSPGLKNLLQTFWGNLSVPYLGFTNLLEL